MGGALSAHSTECVGYPHKRMCWRAEGATPEPEQLSGPVPNAGWHCEAVACCMLHAQAVCCMLHIYNASPDLSEPRSGPMSSSASQNDTDSCGSMKRYAPSCSKRVLDWTWVHGLAESARIVLHVVRLDGVPGVAGSQLRYAEACRKTQHSARRRDRPTTPDAAGRLCAHGSLTTACPCWYRQLLQRGCVCARDCKPVLVAPAAPAFLFQAGRTDASAPRIAKCGDVRGSHPCRVAVRDGKNRAGDLPILTGFGCPMGCMCYDGCAFGCLSRMSLRQTGTEHTRVPRRGARCTSCGPRGSLRRKHRFRSEERAD